VSEYYANVEVWVGGLGPAEDEDIRELIEAALEEQP
jgi:hypothetical protein